MCYSWDDFWKKFYILESILNISFPLQQRNSIQTIFFLRLLPKNVVIINDGGFSSKCMRVARKWEKHVVSYAFINFTRLQKKVSSCNSLIQQCHTKENKVLHKLSKSNWISWVSNCIFFVSISDIYLLYFHCITNDVQ